MNPALARKRRALPPIGNIDEFTDLTTNEAAAYLGVDARTVIRRIRDGTLPARNINPRGVNATYRIPASGVAAILKAGTDTSEDAPDCASSRAS